jgi:hypothetical protein
MHFPASRGVRKNDETFRRTEDAARCGGSTKVTPSRDGRSSDTLHDIGISRPKKPIFDEKSLFMPM